MAHEGLKRACIDSSTGQGVPSSVAQHVSVDREWQLSGHAKPFNQLLGTVDRKRRLTLGQKHEVGVGMLAPQGPQQPQLVTLQAMDAGRTILGAADAALVLLAFAALTVAKLPVFVVVAMAAATGIALTVI